jgi:uncharacterized membrane-anchored protein
MLKSCCGGMTITHTQMYLYTLIHLLPSFFWLVVVVVVVVVGVRFKNVTDGCKEEDGYTLRG